MTDYEYELMQEALRKHLKTSHGYHGVKKDIFNEGIKVAMSMLKQFHEFPRVKDGDGYAHKFYPNCGARMDGGDNNG